MDTLTFAQYLFEESPPTKFTDNIEHQALQRNRHVKSLICRMCVCHMFNKVLTYLLTYLIAANVHVHNVENFPDIHRRKWF